MKKIALILFFLSFGIKSAFADVPSQIVGTAEFSCTGLVCEMINAGGGLFLIYGSDSSAVSGEGLINGTSGQCYQTSADDVFIDLNSLDGNSSDCAGPFPTNVAPPAFIQTSWYTGSHDPSAIAGLCPSGLEYSLDLTFTTGCGVTPPPPPSGGGFNKASALVAILNFGKDIAYMLGILIVSILALWASMTGLKWSIVKITKYIVGKSK